MITFDFAIKLIIAHEGGYVNDPSDPGGETQFGISKRAFPKFDIKNLTENEAQSIYYSEYWLKMNIDGFHNDLLKLHLFDMAVNAGRGAATAILQKIVNVNPDGFIGPKTIVSANEYEDQKSLVDQYIQGRKDYYGNLVKKKPVLLKFLKGWINRVEDTTKYFENGKA